MATTDTLINQPTRTIQGSQTPHVFTQSITPGHYASASFSTSLSPSEVTDPTLSMSLQLDWYAGGTGGTYLGGGGYTWVGGPQNTGLWNKSPSFDTFVPQNADTVKATASVPVTLTTGVIVTATTP